MSNPRTDLRDLARRLVAARAAHGTSRAIAKIEGRISAIGTERAYRSAIHRYLQWRESVELALGGPHLLSDFCEFIEEHTATQSQAWLDLHRQALQITFAVQLPYWIAERQARMISRGLTRSEYEEIRKSASQRSQLSLDLALDGGLRASELYEIRRIDESFASPHRQWSPRRFSGRSAYATYLCTGKGGLAREVALSLPLAAELEARRYASPRVVVDRGIRRVAHYDLAAGQSISQLFTSAARRASGRSLGFHALRHTFAQRRFAELAPALPDMRDRLAVLAQELGHFSWTQPLTYLR